MKALIQRVSEASVTIDGNVYSEIQGGLLVLLGIEKEDDESKASKLVEKLLTYRVFPDKDDKMNLSVRDVDGELLVVSQFTLVADTRKGTRPGFSKGADPEMGKKLYEFFLKEARERHGKIATGQFGADMKVALVNDGPVTFLLET